MGIARKTIQALMKRFATKIMDKAGSKVVAWMADTSSDAPNAFHKPKRNAYAQMKAKESSTATERGEHGSKR
ncbi:MAG: hypothetical protein ACON4U_09655 [Myxococcota bacterium]